MRLWNILGTLLPISIRLLPNKRVEYIIHFEVTSWIKHSFYSRGTFYVQIYICYIFIFDNEVRRDNRLVFPNYPSPMYARTDAVPLTSYYHIMKKPAAVLTTWPARGRYSKSSAALAFEEISRRQSTASIPNHTGCRYGLVCLYDCIFPCKPS